MALVHMSTSTCQVTCQHSLMACCSCNFIDILKEVAYERKLSALYS